MVEGFRMDEFSEEEVQVEVDKVVDYAAAAPADQRATTSCASPA
jgi:type II secretory pathway component PulM